jgi:putative peptidoglycan lipid II flippase
VVRGLGLASQVFAVAVFGAGRQLDAFLVAWIVPNLIAAPYAGGVELGLGPGYAVAREVEPDSLAGHRGAILRLVTRAGIVVTSILMIALPVLIRVSAPGAGDGLIDAAQELAWWIYPTVLASCVSAGCSTILFASGRIQIPVLAQSIRPIALIVALLLSENVEAMAMAACLGAYLEMGANLALVRTCEGPLGALLRGPRPRVGLADSQTRLLTISSATTQLSPAIDQAVVASLGSGKLVLFTIASRFYDVGKAAFIQPSARLSQNRLGIASRDPAELRGQVTFEIRRALQVGIGAALVTAALAPPLVYGLFVRGEFTAADAASASVLAVLLAIAMVPWALASVLPRVLVVQQRTREYVALGMGYVGVNLALDLLFVQLWGVYGVAVATITAIAVFAAAQHARARRHFSELLVQ